MNFFSFLLFFTLALQADFVHAHHLLEVKPIECSKEFPCPEELTKRINFWISVYSKHSSSIAILHDAKNPERVYSILESSQEPCRFSKRKQKDLVVQQERTRIEELLLAIAAKLEAKGQDWTEEERHIVEMFPSGDPQELKDAADNVRCQAGNKNAFREGLARFTVYKDMISSKLEKYKLPYDIMYLPFVESSYNPQAFSRVGAAGLWQIMPKTARKLGLSITRNVDERFDPEMATEAAMKYFRESYETLKDTIESSGLPDSSPHLGPFVITSYNYGILGAKNMITEVGVNFCDVLTNFSGKRFKTAVQNFYASFIAAKYVAANASKYFDNVQSKSPPVFVNLNIQKDIPVKKLSTKLDIGEAALRELNPSLTSRVWRGDGYVPKGFNFKIPFAKDEAFEAKVASLWSPEPQGSLVATQKEPSQEKPATTTPAIVMDESHYRVKSGDSICGIARKHKLDCAVFMKANGLTENSTIIPGQLLSLQQTLAATISPTPEPEFIGPPVPPDLDKVIAKLAPEEVAKTFGIGEDFLVSKSKTGKKGTVKDMYVVVVQSEETLGHFSEWLGLASTAPIRELNRLSKGSSIILGQTLSLPIQTEEQKSQFEEKRIQYHRLLEDEFMERYDIVGEEIYSIKNGDTESSIADKYEVPMWLLRRLNPNLSIQKLRVRDQLRIPLVREKPEGQHAIN